MSLFIRKTILLVFLMLITLAGAFYYLKGKNPNSGEVIITTTPGNIFSKATPTPITVSDDFPPLYPEVAWGEPKSGKFMFTNSKDETSDLDGTRRESSVDEATSEKFMDYYNKTLTRQGWNKTLDAGGPPGIMFGYQKGNKFVNFGVEYTPEGPGPGRKIVKYLIYLELNQ